MTICIPSTCFITEDDLRYWRARGGGDEFLGCAVDPLWAHQSARAAYQAGREDFRQRVRDGRCATHVAIGASQ